MTSAVIFVFSGQLKLLFRFYQFGRVPRIVATCIFVKLFLFGNFVHGYMYSCLLNNHKSYKKRKVYF